MAEELMTEKQAAMVPRVMALDVGAARTGVAMTDAMGWTVQPLLTFPHKSPHLDAKSVARLVRRYGVAEVVVGLPMRLGGERSAQTERVERWVEEHLRGKLEVPVRLVDERLSTVEAHARMDETGGRVRGVKEDRARRGRIDQMAAVVILEGFLADRAHKKAMEERRRAMEEGEEDVPPALV